MNDIAEQQAFEAWRASTRYQPRMTGWMIWCASLAHRGVGPWDVIESRSGFDRWLADTAADNWEEIDAWIAAAWFARIYPLSEPTLPVTAP